MKVVAVYPGRFHPFHKGHASSFNQLAQKFGLDNTYLAISAKQEQPKSPFSAQDRAKMATSLGIPSKNIIGVRNPYAAQEYIDQLNLDPEQTALIFGVSKKDMEGDAAMGIPPDPRFGFNPKKDGSPSYLQPFNKSKVDPMSQHGYIMSTDVAEFPIAGKSMRDASAIRSAYAGADEKTKMRILKDLYGDAAPKMKQVFDNNLQVTESIRRLISAIKPMLSEATIEQKAKFVKLLSEAKKTVLSEAIGNVVDRSYDMTDVDDRISKGQMMSKASELMLQSLTPREEYAIRAKLGLDGEEPMTLEQIGQRMGITKERIRQIIAKGVRKLRNKTNYYDRPLDAQDAPIERRVKELRAIMDKTSAENRRLTGNSPEAKKLSDQWSAAYKEWDELSKKLHRSTPLGEAAGDVYSNRQADIIEDLGNGYFLGDDSYDDDDGFSKAGYSVYKQVGDDSFRLVDSVSMSPYSNSPGHIENEIKKIIASDQNNLSENADYLEEK
jgi:cytidyltransferase-like protein